MKAVATGKTKQWVATALVLAAVFMVARAFLPSGGGAPAPATVATAPAKGTAAPGEESLDPRLHLDLLASSEAVKYEGEGKNIFRATSEAVAIPAVKVSPLLAKQQQQEQAAKALAASLPPPPPPINLKFFGFSNKPGETPKAFLSQGDDVWIAREGDVVDRHYKIVHISPTAVEVEDLLNSNRQSIRLTQG